MSTCFFYKPLGKILIATSKIFYYELEEYKNIKISSEK